MLLFCANTARLMHFFDYNSCSLQTPHFYFRGVFVNRKKYISLKVLKFRSFFDLIFRLENTILVGLLPSGIE